MVHHTHMPHAETARMKSLRKAKQLLLDQAADIDAQLAHLVEHEQRKVFAAFKQAVGAEALETRAYIESLDFGS